MGIGGIWGSSPIVSCSPSGRRIPWGGIGLIFSLESSCPLLLIRSPRSDILRSGNQLCRRRIGSISHRCFSQNDEICQDPLYSTQPSISASSKYPSRPAPSRTTRHRIWTLSRILGFERAGNKVSAIFCFSFVKNSQLKMKCCYQNYENFTTEYCKYDDAHF